MTPPKISVLYVDDEPALLEIGRLFLEQPGDFCVTTLASAQEALASSIIKSCDAIVSDYQMAGMDGIAFLKEVRRKFGDIPFIIFTGRGREEIVIEAINNGADFYLQKGGDPTSQFAELTHKITQAVTRRRTQAELLAANTGLSKSKEELRKKYEELRKSQDDLLQSGQRYRAFFENTGTAATIIESDGTISLANSRFVQLAGFPAGEIEGKKRWQEFVVPEDLGMMENEHRLRRESPKRSRTTYEFRFRTGPGEIRDILLFVDMIPGTYKSVASLMDITDRRHAEKALVQSRERFAQVAELAGEWIWEVDADGRYTYSSQVVEKILGYTPGELVGKKYFFDLFVPEKRDELRKTMLATFREKAVVRHLVNPNVHKNGSTVLLNTSGTPVLADDGTLLGYRGADLDVTERIAAENALHESTERYRLMLMNAKDGIMINELTAKGPGKFIEVNDTACRIIGMTQNELSEISLADLDLQETKDRAPEIMAVLMKDRHMTFRIPFRTKAGVEKFLDISVSLFIFHGQPTMFSIVRDITGEMATQAALRTMVASMVGTTGLDALKRIAESVSAWLGADCVMVGELQPDKTTVNVHAMILDAKEVRDYSYSLEGTPCENVAEKGFCYFPDNVRSLFPGDRDLADMNILGYAGTPLKNYQGDVIGILCVLSRKPLAEVPALREIMEILAVKAAAEIDRFRIEQALHESEEKFKILVETSPDMIWEVDCTGRFRYVSPAIETVTGHSPAEVNGKRISDIVAEEGVAPAIRKLQRYMTSDVPIQPFDIPTRHRDGRNLTVEIRASRILDRKGRLTGFRGVARDVTERRRTEDALMRANRQLTLLGSITRHDVLNKISAILGYLKFASMKCSGDASAEFIKKAEASVIALRSQVEFTRIYQDLASHEPQWTKIDEIVAGLNVPDTLTIRAELGGVRVYADPMIGSVFSNLLDNSIRHGGKVTEIRVYTRMEGTALVIVWEDNGTGIAANDKERIFSRGIGKHTGLGLFLVREILALTGISIRETGEPGSGARFEIEMPEGTYRGSGARVQD
ncbi:MAG: PAS domain S-box protein [Methanoregula sp.]|jgi:PAS domain S-box-containing protein